MIVLASMDFAFDHSNNIIKWLWCILLVTVKRWSARAIKNVHAVAHLSLRGGSKTDMANVIGRKLCWMLGMAI